MIPYVPTTHPMTGDEQQTLITALENVETAHGSYPTTYQQKLAAAKLILNAGFRRTVAQKVSKWQLLSYVMETIMLAYAACVLLSHKEFFVFGGLTALAVSTALTFVAAILINRDIKKDAK